jgi:hypothetical protein
MIRLQYSLVFVSLVVAGGAVAAEDAAPGQYRVAPVKIPDGDLSGELGPRLLALLSNQAARNLRLMEIDRRKAGIEDPYAVVSDTPYFEFFAAGSAYAAAVLVRFGTPGETMAGLSREQLRRRAKGMVEAVAGDHHLGGGAKQWSRFRSARIVHLLGMASWLLWEDLDRRTQLLVARIIEHEADRFLDRPAPARLYEDTQAESNAWTGGGLAVAACMLKSHPHRRLWADKANEYMISAYATADDVASDQVVDGKPLNQWLTAPNAFPDYTAENHGLVHPDYLGAISEMFRCGISFRLAGEATPQAATFNADKVVDLLVFLYLPDGSELYPQGTDYTPRRLDVFLQAGGILPYKPSPRRKACLLRTLGSLEAMAAECPDTPLNGWIGFTYDLGSTWGLTQNYLATRFFGDGGEPLADNQLEAELAGVFASEHGKFVVHRTAKTLSSFSWRATSKPPAMMGMTLPLDKDVLCYPMPWSYVGQVRESGEPAKMKLHSHRLAAHQDGFAVTVELGWCSDKVRQNCAFVSLPDGRSVYLEERRAQADVTVELASSGNVTVFDDTRWVYQEAARTWFGQQGRLMPKTGSPHDNAGAPHDNAGAPHNNAGAPHNNAGALHSGNWINVDDRLGYAVLSANRFHLFAAAGRPCIWRENGTMYDTCRLEFVHVAGAAGKPGRESFEAGELISRFGIISCPGQKREATAALARRIGQAGWQTADDGVLALAVDPYLVYANLSSKPHPLHDGRRTLQLAPKSSGWAAIH